MYKLFANICKSQHWGRREEDIVHSGKNKISWLTRCGMNKPLFQSGVINKNCLDFAGAVPRPATTTIL